MNIDLKIEKNKVSHCSNCVNPENYTLYAHLRLRVRSKLESLHGESQGLVCARDELRGPWVSLAVQHTAMGDNNMTLNLS